MKPRIIDLKETILADNDADAEALRRKNRDRNLWYINLMSSPGSGKTSTILALVNELRSRNFPFQIGVMEADIDSDVDTRTILDAGIPAVQLHTGGMCHLDAEMSRQGLRALLEEISRGEPATPAVDNKEGKKERPTAVILENVGNLVCPAEFDTGAAMNLVILSVPEGDDKPLKYPLMFERCDAVIINKTDALPVFDFSVEKCREYIRRRNERAQVFPVSAKTGAGVGELARWITEESVKFLRGAE